jgi:hypothetical protein
MSLRIRIEVEGDASELAPVLLALADPAHVAELITESVAAVLTRPDVRSIIQEPPASAPAPPGAAALNGDRTSPPVPGDTEGSGGASPTPPPPPAAAVPFVGSERVQRMSAAKVNARGPNGRRYCPDCGGAWGSRLHRECVEKRRAAREAELEPATAVNVVALQDGAPDADGHRHRWKLGTPKDGVTHGVCWCGTERDFHEPDKDWGGYPKQKVPA